MWTKRTCTSTGPDDTQPMSYHGPLGMDHTPLVSTPEGVFWDAHCALVFCDQGVVPMVAATVVRVPLRIWMRRALRGSNKKRAMLSVTRMMSAAWHTGHMPSDDVEDNGDARTIRGIAADGANGRRLRA